MGRICEENAGRKGRTLVLSLLVLEVGSCLHIVCDGLRGAQLNILNLHSC